MKKILLTVSIAALAGCLMLPSLSEASMFTDLGDSSGGGGSSAILTGQVFGYDAFGRRVGVSGASVCNALNNPGTGSDLQACTTTNTSGGYSFTMAGKENKPVDVWVLKTGFSSGASTILQTTGTVTKDFQVSETPNRIP